MWTDKWIGLPYRELGRDRDGLDCLGLFLLLSRERLGRVLPDPRCTTASSIRERVAEAQRSLYRRVSGPPLEGDAVLMRSGRYALHVGYQVDATWMLHIETTAAGSVLERLGDLHIAPRIEGFYRYAA